MTTQVENLQHSCWLIVTPQYILMSDKTKKQIVGMKSKKEIKENISTAIKYKML